MKKAGRFVSFNATFNGDSQRTLSVAVTENPEVSFPQSVTGDAYDAESVDGVWLSDRFADKNGVSVGDAVTLTYSGVTIRATVKGLVKSSEYLICTRDESQLMPDYATYGFAYISPRAYAKATDDAIRSAMAERFRLADTAPEAEKEQKKESGVYDAQAEAAFLAAYPDGKSGTELYAQINVLTPTDKKTFKEQVNEALGTTMHRLTAKEKTQIGTLKALGFRDKRITRHYTSYAFMIGLIGSALGAGLGYGIAYYIMNPNGMMGTYLDLPYWQLTMPLFCYFILFGIIGGLTLIGFLSVKQMLRGTAADALRPYAPKKVKNLALEKTGLWKRFSFGTKWNLRDVMRHKSRTFMSLFGIIGCTILLVGALGMNDTMQAFLDDYYHEAMNYSSRIYLSEPTEEGDDAQAAYLIEKYEGDYSASVAIEIEDKVTSLDVYTVTHDRVRFPSADGGFVTLGDGGAYLCERLARELHKNRRRHADRAAVRRK